MIEFLSSDIFANFLLPLLLLISFAFIYFNMHSFMEKVEEAERKQFEPIKIRSSKQIIEVRNK